METSPHTQEAAHPTPRTYVAIAALLAAITGFEVAIFYVEAIRDILIPIFFVMSAVKFALVAMFYMHLKFDHRLFTWLFVGCLTLATSVILALMALFGVLLDTPSYDGVAEVHDEGTAPEAKVHGEATTPEAKDSGVPAGSIILEIGPVADNLQFNTESLTVKTGSEVVLRFSNSATTQQHNWVLVQDGAKDQIATVALTAGAASDWVPEDERIIAHTKLIPPGESGDVSFTAPAAGTYQYVCTFPGHNATMFGTFEVSP